MPIVARDTLDRKIVRVVDEAIELADLGTIRFAAESVAQRIYDQEAELMEQVRYAWTIERLVLIIKRRRRERKYHENFQLALPDPIFQDLPRRIFLRNGKRPKLDYCTVTETDDHLKLLRNRFPAHPRVVQMEAVVKLHRKWSERENGISWLETKQREISEREKT